MTKIDSKWNSSLSLRREKMIRRVGANEERIRRIKIDNRWNSSLNLKRKRKRPT